MRIFFKFFFCYFKFFDFLPQLRHKITSLNTVFNINDQIIIFPRFLNITVKSYFVNCTYSIFFISITCQKDFADFGIKFFYFGKKLKTVHFRHHKIRDYQIRLIFFQENKSFFRGIKNMTIRKTFHLKQNLKCGSKHLFIINDYNLPLIHNLILTQIG